MYISRDPTKILWLTAPDSHPSLLAARIPSGRWAFAVTIFKPLVPSSKFSQAQEHPDLGTFGPVDRVFPTRATWRIILLHPIPRQGYIRFQTVHSRQVSKRPQVAQFTRFTWNGQHVSRSSVNLHDLDTTTVVLGTRVTWTERSHSLSRTALYQRTLYTTVT